MLKITRKKNAQVVFAVSGRLDSDNVAELKRLISAETKGQLLILELSELTHVGEDAVLFLESCETNVIDLKNCPAYVREWITKERGGGQLYRRSGHQKTPVRAGQGS
jgi:hypothetical protein